MCACCGCVGEGEDDRYLLKEDMREYPDRQQRRERRRDSSSRCRLSRQFCSKDRREQVRHRDSCYGLMPPSKGSTQCYTQQGQLN